jgi:hypothetical protein
MGEVEKLGVCREIGEDFIGPLDAADPSCHEVFIEARSDKCFGTREPIEIKVVERKGS